MTDISGVMTKNQRETNPLFSGRYAMILLVGALAILPLVGVFAPRAIAFLPAIIGLLGILYHYFRGRVKLDFRPFMGLILFLMGLGFLMVASSLWAVDSEAVMDRVQKSLPIFLGAVLLAAFIKSWPKNWADFFPKVVLIFLLLAGLGCIGQIFMQLNAEDLLNHDAPEKLSEFNRGAIVYVFCLSACLFLFFSKKNESRVFRVIFILNAFLFIGAFFLTDSQSLQLAVLVSAVLIFLFPYGRAWAWNLLSVLLVGAILLAPFLAIGMFEYFMPLVKDVSWFVNGSAASRMEIWDFVARRALERPLLGHGLEATRTMHDFDTQQLFHKGTSVLHPHNFALQIWMEFGAVGAVFFSAFFVWIIKSLQKFPRDFARFFLPLFIACISMAATSYGLWQGWWLGLFSLIFGYGIIAQKAFEADQS